MLHACTELLDVTTVKILYTFYEVIVSSSEDGKLNADLWGILNQWSLMIVASVQHIESCNSIVVKVTGLSPFMDEVLTAARITTIKDLISRGHSKRKRGKKAIVAAKDSLLDALDLCLDNHGSDEYKAISMHYSRFLQGGEPFRLPPSMVAASRAALTLPHDSAPAPISAAAAADGRDLDGDALFEAVFADAACPASEGDNLEDKSDMPEHPESPPGSCDLDNGEDVGDHADPRTLRWGDEHPWLRSLLQRSRLLPFGLSLEDLRKSGKPALRWSCAFGVTGPALRCFWLCRPGAGVHLPEPGRKH